MARRTEFAEYRRKAGAALRVLRDARGEQVYEQAVPSYTHANPLMQWVFWQRLRVVMRYLERIKIGRALDYGCGTGVLLPFLTDNSTSVIAADLVAEPSELFLKFLGRPRHSVITSPDFLRTLPDGSLDTIVATDVLEHVDNLEEKIAEFRRVLSPGGRVVVSGPTESVAYRMGRWLAGYKHHSHVRNVFTIEQSFADTFRVHRIVMARYPMPFFRIFAAEHPAT